MNQMWMIKYKYLLTFLLLFSFALPVISEVITIKLPILKSPRPSQNITAGFMTLQSEQKLTINKIYSPGIDRIEIHTMKMEDGVMKMRKMLKPQVSPKSPLELKHGGNHLMLFGINKILKPGNKTNLIFEFQTEDKKTFTKIFTFNIN